MPERPMLICSACGARFARRRDHRVCTTGFYLSPDAQRLELARKLERIARELHSVSDELVAFAERERAVLGGGE